MLRSNDTKKVDLRMYCPELNSSLYNPWLWVTLVYFDQCPTFFNKTLDWI